MSAARIVPMQSTIPVGMKRELLEAHSQRREPPPGKCTGCGSRHFVTHQKRRICSYCRGEQ